MRAIVLRSISPEIKENDVLTLRPDGFYVKEGAEKAKVQHTIRPTLLQGLKVGFKKTIVHSPNYYPQDEVENMKEWFKVQK